MVSGAAKGRQVPDRGQSRTGDYEEREGQEPRALNAGCMIHQYEPVTFEELVANNRSFQEDSKGTGMGENYERTTDRHF